MGGGQLLGNNDDVMVPPGSGLPVGNSCKWFQCIVHEICIFKEKYVFILYFVFLIKAGKDSLSQWLGIEASF